ncbi:hypothetical protein BGX29_011278, partial [Mortierella sp. GBA35]
APVPADRLQYTFYPDKTLYIRGGLNQGNPVAQFFSLDLTPLLVHSGKLTWKRLDPAGASPEFRSMMPMAATRLNQAVIIFNENRTIFKYNTLTDKWTGTVTAATPCSPFSEDKNLSLKGGLASTMDPKSGLTYIPYGYANRTQMLVWTVGAIAPEIRDEMACTTAGDYFLFWGGSDHLFGSPADIVFYNVRIDKWVKQTDIAPPANTSIGTVPSSTGISTGTPDTTLALKSNAAAIGGGIAGAVVVTVAIVGFLLVRRRRHRTQAGTKRDGSPDIVTVAFPDGKSDTPPSSTHTSPRRTSNAYAGSSVEKVHVIGNPQLSTTPPINEGGGYVDTQGYGQSTSYPPPPPPIPARPQLYNNLPQYRISNNSPQYISPSALALGEVFPQPPPTVRNPQGVQNSNTNNDDNFDKL